MRRGSILSSTFVFQVAGFGTVAAWAAPAWAGTPKIHVAETHKDLGTIIEGDKPTITWLVRNEGTADLIIDRTQSTCGCTVVKLEDKDKLIPPGGALELKVEFHSAGRRGAQTKHVNVFTNDPENPETKLEFRINVDPLYDIDPPGMLNARAAQRGAAVEKTIDILPSAGHVTVEISGVQFDNDPPLTHEIEPIKLPSGVGRRIRLRVANTASLGTIATIATISASVDGAEREIKLPIRADVIGDLSWTPIVLDASRQTLVAGRALPPVTVRSTEKAVFEVLDADAGPLLEVTHEQVSGPPGRCAFSITPRVREDAPPGPFAAMLRIRTNSLDQPLIQVPVFGLVTPGLEAEPPIILLRPDGTPAGTQRSVRLQADPGKELTVTGVTCENPSIRAGIDTSVVRKPPHQQFLRVQLADNAAGPVKTSLRVATNVPGFEEFEIPLVVDAAGQNR